MPLSPVYAQYIHAYSHTTAENSQNGIFDHSATECHRHPYMHSTYVHAYSHTTIESSKYVIFDHSATK